MDDEIKTGGSDSILAALWRKILKDYGIDAGRLDSLITTYVDRIDNASLDAEQRSQIRGNLRSELKKPTMTWNAFIKGMKVLRVLEFVLVFKLKHMRLISTHRLTYTMALDDDDNEDEPNAKKPNTLSLFFSSVLQDLNINLKLFDDLMTHYMRRSHIPLTISNRTHVRGNLKKELLGPKLTWRSLVKGFNFLCTTRLELNLELLSKGDHSHHKHVVILNDEEDLIDAADLIKPIET